jgi:4-amino-4-deoxy-L-arabinose transferase-like glycosyltransferase
MGVPERLKQTRSLLVAMVLIQVLVIPVKIRYSAGVLRWDLILPSLLYALIVGVAIVFMPVGLVGRLRQVRERLVRDERLFIFTLCLVVLVAGAFFLHRPRVHPDEACSFQASKVVAVGGVASFFADYGQLEWLGHQHPPLVPLVYGISMRLFGLHLAVNRAITLVLGLAIIIITYYLGRELYERYVGLVAACFLLTIPIFPRLVGTANNDIPVTFCFSLAVLIAVFLLRSPTYRLSVAAGVVAGAGLLSKYTMVFILPMLIGWFVFHSSSSRLRLHLGIVSLVMLTMLATWLVFAHQNDMLAVHADRITKYVGAGKTDDGGLSYLSEDWRTEFRLRHLISWPYQLGIYNLPILLLGGLYVLRRRSQADLFALLWIAAVFLPVLLTLPDIRYFVPAMPAVALVMAHGLRRFAEVTEQALVLGLFYCIQNMYLITTLWNPDLSCPPL